MPVSVLLTMLLIAVTVPHTVEDFHFDEFHRFGVAPWQAAIVLSLVYVVQVAGAFFAGQRSRGGFALLLVGGLIWAVGAFLIHGHEIAAAGVYRNGFISKAMEVAIIGLGIAVVIAADVEGGRLKKR
jgi:hypothetical protein